MNLTWQTRKLTLHHPWTLSRGSDSTKEYWFLEIEENGVIGLGEAAHVAYQGESLESVAKVFETARAQFADRSPDEIQVEEIHALATGDHAAKAAIDMACLDWSAKGAGKTLTEYLELETAGKSTPPTSYSISISDDRAVLREKIELAEPFEILKIKLGSDRDRQIIEAVREFTEKTIRVDANEGWTSKVEALAMIEWLAERKVELIEQPMPKGRFPELAWLRERSPLPLIADEDVKTRADIPALIESGAYDGINIKLMKSGGVREALAMIEAARAAEMKVMLGCMIESSLAIGAAKHLAPLTDFVDLDGNLLIKDDPFEFDPTRPGIGAMLRTFS